MASGDIPFPHLWIVDAQVALFREQLGEKFWKKFGENWNVLVRKSLDFRGIFHREDAKCAKDFCLCEPGAGAPGPLVLTEKKRSQKKTSPPGPLSIHGEGECG